ncbi:MAG: hypothetical protein QM755_23890 [Luteolibacter sp.]
MSDESKNDPETTAESSVFFERGEADASKSAYIGCGAIIRRAGVELILVAPTTSDLVGAWDRFVDIPLDMDKVRRLAVTIPKEGRVA